MSPLVPRAVRGRGESGLRGSHSGRADRLAAFPPVFGLLLLLAGCGGETGTGTAAPPSEAGPAAAAAPEGPLLRGLVLDEARRPLPGVAVRALIPFGAGHRARTEGLSATTVADGSFALDLVGAFDPAQEVPVVLFAALDGFVPFRDTIRAFRRTTGLSVEVLLLRGGTLAGRVTDPSGAPVAGARVFAAALDQPGFVRIDGIPGTETDADGRFEIRGVPPGTMDLGVSAPEHVPAVAGPFTVAPGRTTETGDLPVRPGEAISGTVRTARGEPVAGAAVRAFRRPEYRDYAFFGRASAGEAGGRDVTGEDGAFRIAGLAGAPYTVEAEAPGHRTVDAGTRDVRPGGPPLAFVLEPDCWLELAVVSAATGAPLPRYDLLLTRVGGGISRREEVTGGGLHRVPLDRDVEYDLDVSAEGHEVVRRRILIRESGAVPLRVPLPSR